MKYIHLQMGLLFLGGLELGKLLKVKRPITALSFA